MSSEAADTLSGIGEAVSHFGNNPEETLCSSQKNTHRCHRVPNEKSVAMARELWMDNSVRKEDDTATKVVTMALSVAQSDSAFRQFCLGSKDQ
jgi:hypothetical protein